jgi:soluble cytochrome b562
MKREGRLERAIRDAFAAHPDETFITDELAWRCYPDAASIERKHRVAVLRAVSKVLATRPGDDADWRGRYASGLGNILILYNAASVQSTAMARHRRGYINASRQWLAERTREDQKALTEAESEVGAHAVMRYGTPEEKRLVSDRREALQQLQAAKLSVAAAVAKHPMAVMRNAQRTAAVDLSELAEKARRLMVENDPDSVRAGLEEIAARLDAVGRQIADPIATAMEMLAT